jgi:hypothetical protein
LARDFLEFTFIFIGTRLKEPLFWHHIHRLMSATGFRAGQSFIVAPSFSANDARALSDKNIVPLEGTLTDFLDGLQASLGSSLPAVTVLEAQSDAISALRKTDLGDDVAHFADELFSLLVVNRRRLAASFPPIDPRVRPFYYGSEPTWRDILDGVPAQLEALDSIKAALESDAREILVHGPAGSGKTTLMMMAALDYATAHPEVLVLWCDKTSLFPRRLLSMLDERLTQPILVVMDDASRAADDLHSFIANTPAARTRLALCDRTNIYRRTPSLRGLEIDCTRRVARIAKSDVVPILQKLEQFGPWARLKTMSQEERECEIYEVAQRQLLVGLREATSGIGYDRIIADEYQRLESGYPLIAFNVVAVASMHRTPISVRTFRIAVEVLGLSWQECPSDLTEGLEEVVFRTGDYLHARHPYIAEHIAMHVIDEEDVLATVRAILHGIARLGVPVRQTAPGAEARLFAALTNHEFLRRRFARRSTQIVSLYESLGRHFGQDPLFIMHQALFEQTCGKEGLMNAINHIRTALDMWPTSYQILNAYANIHFDAAVNASGPAEALSIMEAASEVLEEQCEHPRTAAYALVGLCWGRISVLLQWWPEKAGDEWRALARRLQNTERHHAGNPEITRALREIPLMIARGRVAGDHARRRDPGHATGTRGRRRARRPSRR